MAKKPTKNDLTAELSALAIDPTTGEPWAESAPEWHDYIAAAYDAAHELLGVEYFERCKQGHRIAAASMRPVE